MSDYSRMLSMQKDAVTKLVMDLHSEDERSRRFGHEQLPIAIDQLNKCWDELTEVRDAKIAELMNELAEAKKR